MALPARKGGEAGKLGVINRYSHLFLLLNILFLKVVSVFYIESCLCLCEIHIKFIFMIFKTSWFNK